MCVREEFSWAQQTRVIQQTSPLPWSEKYLGVCAIAAAAPSTTTTTTTTTATAAAAA